MTLRWPILLWPPKSRVTATTRRGMRTPRPSTGEETSGFSSTATLNECQERELRYEIDSVPSVDLDMLHISHAKKAQDLATETTYRTVLHDYTSLPTDMNVSWAKKAYGLQSEVSLAGSASIEMCSCHKRKRFLSHQTPPLSICRNNTGRI